MDVHHCAASVAALSYADVAKPPSENKAVWYGCLLEIGENIA
jgi:hypothetical protein